MPAKETEEQFKLLLGTPCGPPAEQDERGCGGLGFGQQRGEVGVGRDKHPMLGSSHREDLTVRCGLEATVPDMRRVVVRATQPLGQKRRERVVDEESQEAARNGRSRWRTLSAA